MTTETTPEEITLPMATMLFLQDHPDLMAELDELSHAARAKGPGYVVPEMAAWLDARGLRWRAGGSSPEAAFADAFADGVVECGHYGAQDARSSGPNRKARRKAQRVARRRSR